MYRRLTVAGFLIFHILLVGWIALCKSPVVDEAPHLVAGIIHCKFGTFDLYRVNPPLVRSVAALPVLIAGIETDWMGGWADNPFARPEFLLGRRLLEVNPERCFWLVTLARWACLPFTLLGAIICYLWARDLYGTNAGMVALLLWCFDPNLMGWSATLCPDAPAASVGVLAAYVYWRWLRQPSWGGIWLAGLAFGMALLTKSTWLVLFGIWPAVWLMWYLIQRRPDEQTTPRSTPPSGIGVVMILLIGLYVVNAGYGFASCLRPVGNFSFISGALAGEQPFGQIGNRFRGSWFETIPVPLPADFVIGVDVQRYEFEKGKWSYLRGQQKFGGWWWYYLYALAVKTPVGTMVLFALALATRPWLASPQFGKRDELLLLVPATIVLVLVSSQTGFNRYLRYVLPALPFVFVWLSRVALLLEPCSPKLHYWHRITKITIVVCLAAVVWSSLRVWPHSMSYFNAIVGGPENGHRHLLDANIDWGQDLLELKRWIEKRSLREPLFVSEFGWIDRSLAGIEAPDVPALLFDDRGHVTSGNLEALQAGWYAVSVNHLMGYRNEPTDRPCLTWLQEFQPIDRAGYSIWIFHLTEEDVQGFRQRHHSESKTPDDG